eukprot:symbB.v1.2.034615.t1/scaffold4500.1/size38868/2
MKASRRQLSSPETALVNFKCSFHERFTSHTGRLEVTKAAQLPATLSCSSSLEVTPAPSLSAEMICSSAPSPSAGLSPAFADSVSTAGAAGDVSGFSEAI